MSEPIDPAETFVRALKDLYENAGSPTLKALAKKGLPTSTVSNWLAGLSVPGNEQQFLLLVQLLTLRAREAGAKRTPSEAQWVRLRKLAWAFTHPRAGTNSGVTHRSSSGKQATAPRSTVEWARQGAPAHLAAATPVGGLLGHGMEWMPEKVVGLPPRNPEFMGRVDLLAGLAVGLESGPVAVVAVHGLGGIGKSQVALEFAHRGVASGRYQIAWWVRAESAMTLAEDLAALGPRLGIPVVADQEQMVAAVTKTLQQRSGWLLVFDNAPDVNFARGWSLATSGDLVITSRSRDWREFARPVEVEVFTRAESVEFLAQGTDGSLLLLNELASLVGDLPLALAQAVAYMQRAGGLTVAAYLDLYRDVSGAGRLLAAGAGGGYPESVATTWLIHFRWLAEHEPTALELLRLCAFLDPDEINLELLLSRPDLLRGDLTGQLAALCGDPAGKVETVAVLIATSLLSRADDNHVRMHRLVSLAIRRHLTTDCASLTSKWALHVMGLLAELMPDEPWQPAAGRVCAQLAPHVTAAAEHSSDRPATAVALAKLGQYLDERAEYATAKTHLQRALAIFETTYGPYNPEVAATLGNLGIVERQLGELVAAKTYLLRALDIKAEVYGPDHPEVAVTLGGLGIVERQLGESDAAKAHLLRALAIKEEVYGPGHAQVAITLVNLGSVERKLGELASARAHLQRALETNEAVYGSDHPQVAVTLGGLGNVERESGELAAAKACHLRALEIFEVAYGSDHPRVAVALVNLGQAERELGDLTSAEARQWRALEINEATYGPDHPETNWVRSLIGQPDFLPATSMSID